MGATQKSVRLDLYQCSSRFSNFIRGPSGVHPGSGKYKQGFEYGADEQRRVSRIYNSSNTKIKETIYIPGGYEVEKCGTVTRKMHYIPVGDSWALYVKNSGGQDSTYFLLTDHLGSVNVIASSTGTKLKEFNFDPWGRRRNPTDWTYTNVPAISVTSRGFTMHEHMDQFKLINMNGRVYDPVLGQFLSPDPIIANASSTQSYNRYAYCNYNPLKYTDPSGYLVAWGGGRGPDQIYHGGGDIFGGGGSMSSPFSNSGSNWVTQFYGNFGSGPDFEQLYTEVDGKWIRNTEMTNVYSDDGSWNTDEIVSLAENDEISTLINGLIKIYGYTEPEYYSQVVYESGNMWLSAAVDYRTSMTGYFFVFTSGSNSFSRSAVWENASGGGDGFNIWEDISNSLLVGASSNQSNYFRSSQIAKEGRFAVNGWKTYSNAFRGNQYISSASVNEAKAAFNTVAKTTSRISTGLTLVSFGITYANHAAGNVSDGRYYVQQTINAIGLFGPWGAGIAIGLGTIDAVWGDQIESWIRK